MILRCIMEMMQLSSLCPCVSPRCVRSQAYARLWTSPHIGTMLYHVQYIVLNYSVTIIPRGAMILVQVFGGHAMQRD